MFRVRPLASGSNAVVENTCLVNTNLQQACTTPGWDLDSFLASNTQACGGEGEFPKMDRDVDLYCSRLAQITRDTQGMGGDWDDDGVVDWPDRVNRHRRTRRARRRSPVRS